MRRPLIAGNWKMNLVMEEVVSLIEGILQGGSRFASVDVLICPPFPYLERAVAMTQGTEIQVGAQNVYHENGGLHRGGVSTHVEKPALFPRHCRAL